MSLSDPHEKFQVVMLYEHLAFAGEAMDTYAHLTRELGEEFIPELRIWRLDEAGAEEFVDEARHDLAAADLILMAIHGDEPCPPAFVHWKEKADGERAGFDHAIIALLDDHGAPPTNAETWSSVLGGAAIQIHPEIFVCEPVE